MSAPHPTFGLKLRDQFPGIGGPFTGELHCAACGEGIEHGRVNVVLDGPESDGVHDPMVPDRPTGRAPTPRQRKFREPQQPCDCFQVWRAGHPWHHLGWSVDNEHDLDPVQRGGVG